MLSNASKRTLSAWLSLVAPAFFTVPALGQPPLPPVAYDVQSNHSGEVATFLSYRVLPPALANRQPHLYIAEGKGQVRQLVQDPTCDDGRPMARISSPAHVPGTESSFSYHVITECRFGRFNAPLLHVRIANNPWIRDKSPGYLRWSGMGSYAALSYLGETRLISMADGTDAIIPALGPNGRPLRFDLTNGLSDRGQVLLREPATLPSDGTRLYLWENGIFTELDLPLTTFCALDPQSRYIVCVTDESPVARCIMLDLITGERKVLDDLPLDPTLFVFAMNATGDRILFQKSRKDNLATEGEIFSMPDLKRTHRLPATGGSVAFSGDGRFLFAGRQDGSLRRFDLETGAEEIWLEPAP